MVNAEHNDRTEPHDMTTRPGRPIAALSPSARSNPRGPLALVSRCGLAAVVAASGCTNPLTSDESDYGDRLPMERLREIEKSNLDEYKRVTAPASESTDVGDRASPDPATDAKKRFERAGSTDLTLEACRASALEHNLDLKVAFINPTIAEQSVSEEEGRFEAAFTTRALWQETDAPTSSTLSSAQAKQQSIEPGVRIPLRSGETVNVSIPFSRSETNNQFSTLNPAYTTDLNLSVSQPLLRGAGRRANTAALRIASYNKQAEDSRTKLEAIRQLAAVDRAYWRLYQVRRELNVRQQQYELADVQLRSAQRRVETGRSPEIEVIRAQSGLADRLEAIIIAQNNVLIQQRELKRIINLPGLTVDSTVLVVPTTEPDPVEFLFETGVLMERALENRMEMLELELRLAADAATIDLNKNNALPLLTMDYTYRVNGLGATLSESNRVLSENRFEDWSIGLNAEIPLGNESALARVRRSILTRLQRLGTRAARELAIRQEVLGAADQINAGWQRILASRQSSLANARALAAEQRQFDVGLSTSTNVLDAASRLAESQSSEIRALTDYEIARVDLAFATGTLLGAGKIRWEPTPAPDAELKAKDYFPMIPESPASQRREQTPDSGRRGSSPAVEGVGAVEGTGEPATGPDAAQFESK